MVLVVSIRILQHFCDTKCDSSVHIMGWKHVQHRPHQQASRDTLEFTSSALFKHNCRTPVAVLLLRIFTLTSLAGF